MQKAPRLWLQGIRIKRDMTHQEVADKAGISRVYYTQIETGARSPSVKTAKKIESALNIPWTLFYEEEKNKKNNLSI